MGVLSGQGLLTQLFTSGSRLLSADADGQIKCWSMADHLANSWESSVGSQVEGDPIVALSWLHNGVKLALHVEKVSDPLRGLRDRWDGTQSGQTASSLLPSAPQGGITCQSVAALLSPVT